MASIFQCDRCKRYDDNIGPNAWQKKPKYCVMITPIGEQDSEDYLHTRKTELCDECSKKVLDFIKLNDVK